ncbi:hypothetical protein BH10PSE7_BH10PSE7_15600 [soil metagenome]
MDRDQWSAVLTLVGVMAGAGGTLFVGLFKARREGVTSVSIAEIGDRDKFRRALMAMVEAALARAQHAEDRADMAEKRADEAEARADVAEKRADQAEETAYQLQDQVTALATRMTQHEGRCAPR